ncbi:hypothetical protein [Spirillospora sp. NPDC029432]|uniref:hypothetical protein n=1 Tax=Spirillospora sp. NPDC029432 TaxID=3154599 RepID=UPI0034522798
MEEPFLTDVRWTGSVLRVEGRLGSAGGAPGEPSIVLRERDGDRRLRVPAARTGAGAFRAEIDTTAAADGAPLPTGLWDLELAAGDAPPLPLGREHGAGPDLDPQRRFRPDATAVTAYFSVYGPLAIDVGGASHPGDPVRADELAWNGHDEELVVTGRLALESLARPLSATLALRERRTGRIYEVIAALQDARGRVGYAAAVPMTRAFVDDPLPRGSWEAFLVLGFSGMHRELRLMAPDRAIERRVRRRLVPVRFGTTRAPEPLTITVGRRRA